MKAATKPKKMQLGLAGVLSAGLAFGMGVAPASSATSEEAPAEDTADAQLDVDVADESGFEATLVEGAFEEQSDGSIVILDKSGDELFILETEVPLQDGDVVEVEYAVDGTQQIEASYSTEVDPEDVMLPPQPRNADCISSGFLLAGSGAALIGSALTAPATAGGSLVVGGSALAYTGSSIAMLQDCYA